jgi:dTMP kinase
MKKTNNLKLKTLAGQAKNSGALIVIEGLDGSGKATQCKLLVAHLKREGKDVMVVDFPQYGKPSAALVEMYLNGDFGEAKQVSPYQASIFYAADRFAAKKAMQDHLAKGGVIVSNRYTTANMMHQAGKITDTKKRTAFLKWLDHLEFEIFGIPRPTQVFFLDVPPSISQKLVATKEKRSYLKTGTHDIHEKDKKHLEAARKTGRLIARKYKWVTIECVTKGGEMKSIDEIHQLIVTAM